MKYSKGQYSVQRGHKAEAAQIRKQRRLGVLWLVALLVFGAMVWADERWSPEWAVGQLSPFDSPLPAELDPARLPRMVNEIVHPREGDAIAGETQIIGTALIVDFMRYDIHIARAGEDRWSWVTSDSRVVYDHVIHTLNTRGYSDGRYDLRVRALDMRGTYTEAFVRNLEIRNARPPTPTPDPNAPRVPRSPLPPPTPTPNLTTRLPGGTGLYAPDNGAILRGSVNVLGAVSGQFRNPVNRWDVAIAPMRTENWTVIRSGSDQGMGLTVATWETTQYNDGLYDLRLRVIYQDGAFTDYFLRELSVANTGQPRFAFLPQPGIQLPSPGELLSGVFSVSATVPPSPDLMHWELAWTRQEEERWELLTTGDRAVHESEILRLDLRAWTSGVYDLRLRIVHRDAQPGEYFVRSLQVQGAPVSEDGDPETGDADDGN